MKSGIYRIGGHTAEIISRYDAVHTLCRDYAVSISPELRIETTEADIDFEREKNSEPYSDAYLETLAVYRKLVEALLSDNILLFHASAVAVDGKGYLFAAPSGTGKSTHARLWRELLGDRLTMVNDDKPLLHITETGVEVYGTPWCGKHGLQTPTHVPVRGICLLHQAEENQIRPITALEALPMLLRQTYRPSEQEALKTTIKLLERLCIHVPLWAMGCKPDLAAAALAFETMSGINTETEGGNP